MKFLAIFLLTTFVICSTRAFPASSNPDNDAEVIQIGSQDPSSYPLMPSYPAVPRYPSLPSIPTIPVLPSYPTYTYGYIPIGWTYNLLDNFSNLFQRVGHQASSTWSRLPSIRPFIQNYWPDVKTNGSTTSTVKVVGDHKFIINETVHVQENSYGHIVFKVKTVDIKPASGTEVTTEESSEEPSIVPDAKVPNTTENRESESDETFESDGSDESDREPVTDAGERDFIDEGVNIDGNSGSFDDGNDIARNSIGFENSELIESTERNEEIKSIPLKLGEQQFEIEPLSSETATEKQNELHDIEIEANIRDTDNSHPSNTYYTVAATENNDDSDDETIAVPIDLSNDIAINEMLADQGATHNPYAEIFDVHQFGMKAHGDLRLSSHETKETKQESFDYLPYHHHLQTANQLQSIK